MVERGRSPGSVVAPGGTPAVFARDERTARRFWEFFAAGIRNRNTRQAYLTAVRRFGDWCALRGVELADVGPMVVAAYVEDLSRVLAPTTVKQHLAAIRMLFDWLVLGQAVPFNPAAPVRGPRVVVRTGKTPALTAEETRALLDGIDVSGPVGLRDRALIGTMVYSFARVSAAVGMRVRDYYAQGRRAFFRLHEKGGRYNVVPAHHAAAGYVDAYLEVLDGDGGRDAPLFRAVAGAARPARLGPRPLSRQHATRMVKRRARAAGLPEEICSHSFRATGITEYLRNGGRPRARGAHRRARVAAHHPALQPRRRGDHPRRDRAHTHLRPRRGCRLVRSGRFGGSWPRRNARADGRNLGEGTRAPQAGARARKADRSRRARGAGASGRWAGRGARRCR